MKRVLGSLALACLFVAGCGEITRQEIQSKFEGYARSRPVTGGFVNVMCGWDPPLYSAYENKNISITLSGDGDAGTGEVSAKLALSPSHTCEGNAAFKYHRRKRGDGTSYIQIEDLHRTDPWPAAVGKMIALARPIPIDSETALELQPGVTPDGSNSAMVKVDIPNKGKHCIRVPLSSSDGVFTAFQNGQPIRDPFGAISDLTLEPGPVYVLVVSKTPMKASVTVRSVGCS